MNLFSKFATQATRALALSVLVALPVSAMADLVASSTGPSNPDFVKVGVGGAIAEFRGNANQSSWTVATGDNTHDSAQMSNDIGSSSIDWNVYGLTNWTFAVSSTGIPTLTLTSGDFIQSLTYEAGLSADKRVANTLEIHAKRYVDLFIENDGTSLSGDGDDNYGVDFAYYDLGSGIDGLSMSGTINFREGFGDQAFSGVTFKVGNMSPADDDATAQVPEPGMLALLGAGFLGLVLIRRRRNI